jgi:uncharacterized protein (TIGR00375 family)
MQVDCDFHIHGRYSGATSESMNLSIIASQGKLKGLDLIGTGDALHPRWLEEIKDLEVFSDGIYEKDGSKFILTTEVEDQRRVHHLIFLPSISAAEELRESLSKFSQDIDVDGRPHVRLNGEELIDHVEDVGGIAGPSHAFVPWTSIYKEYDSLRECYGKNTTKIEFLELGLSADTDMADLIEELYSVTLLSNSDAHSPWPHRLGREFNRLELRDLSFSGVIEAIKNKKVILNVGLDPRLGKYHRSACISCYAIYTLKEAIRSKWRCKKCGGLIKKGVHDRVKELSSRDKPKHPPYRPRYIRIAPLAEILSLALGIKNIYSSKIQDAWKKLVTRFGSEISVLVDQPIEEIRKAGGGETANLIRAFREGKFKIIEGGGGKYGKVVFNIPRQKFYRGNQSMLDSFIGPIG